LIVIGIAQCLPLQAVTQLHTVKSASTCRLGKERRPSKLRSPKKWRATQLAGAMAAGMKGYELVLGGLLLAGWLAV